MQHVALRTTMDDIAIQLCNKIMGIMTLDDLIFAEQSKKIK